MLIAKIKSIEAADLNAAIEGKPTKPSHISNWSAIAKFMCHIWTSGVSAEDFDLYIRNGILLLWTAAIKEILEEGQLRINQTIKSEMTPLVTILLEDVK